MITGYYCTNIFSEQAKELIEFYGRTLEIPFIKTNDDNSNGVYFGTSILCDSNENYWFNNRINR